MQIIIVAITSNKPGSQKPNDLGRTSSSVATSLANRLMIRREERVGSLYGESRGR